MLNTIWCHHTDRICRVPSTFLFMFSCVTVPNWWSLGSRASLLVHLHVWAAAVGSNNTLCLCICVSLSFLSFFFFSVFVCHVLLSVWFALTIRLYMCAWVCPYCWIELSLTLSTLYVWILSAYFCLCINVLFSSVCHAQNSVIISQRCVTTLLLSWLWALYFSPRFSCMCNYALLHTQLRHNVSGWSADVCADLVASHCAVIHVPGPGHLHHQVCVRNERDEATLVFMVPC